MLKVKEKVNELLDIILKNPRQAYDMHDVINSVADSGSVFTIQPMFGQSLITCFAD